MQEPPAVVAVQVGYAWLKLMTWGLGTRYQYQPKTLMMEESRIIIPRTPTRVQTQGQIKEELEQSAHKSARVQACMVQGCTIKYVQSF